MRSRHGFTLIELLVVIAIITILAAILFPVFARAREKARQSSCLSNLKQVATAELMYEQDYDQHTGCYCDTIGASSRARMSWCDMLAPYVKNTQLYQCPSAALGTDVYAGYAKIGYFYNGLAGARGDGSIKSPSGTFLVGDLGCNNTGYLPHPFPSVPSPSDINVYAQWSHTGSNAAFSHWSAWSGTRDAEIHNGGWNYAFFDGHAKWINTQTLSDNNWAGWTSHPPYTGTMP